MQVHRTMVCREMDEEHAVDFVGALDGVESMN